MPTEPTDAVCAGCGRDTFVPGTPAEQRRDCGWCRQVEEGLAPAPSVAPDFEAAELHARGVAAVQWTREGNLARAYLALRVQVAALREKAEIVDAMERGEVNVSRSQDGEWCVTIEFNFAKNASLVAAYAQARAAQDRPSSERTEP